MTPNRSARNDASFLPPHRSPRRLLGSLTLWLIVSVLGLGAIGGGAAAATRYDASADGYSMANVTSQMGASAWWDAGYTGSGVDVALIDTGVSPVEALRGTGKLVYGPDLSLDSHAPNLRNRDGYGHGTFMAGLIAGHDPSLLAPYSQAPASAYRGVAPDARIISVKVGARDGAVDVTQVIAAIDWVVQHAHDPGFDIRVINLSYGTESRQSYTVDPLAYAAEQAWKHGIVVVAAAGNTGDRRGPGAPGLADPAYDPYVIAVGGYDTGDDSIGSYSASSRGGAGRRPDFVAPGSHLQGLRVPGSYVDDHDRQGLLDGRYRRGSGTSEATALASGAIALILQKYPTLSPDEVKQFIERNAARVPGADADAQGSGALDLRALLHAIPQGFAGARVLPLPALAQGASAPNSGTLSPAVASLAPALWLQPADAPTFSLQRPPAAAARYPASDGDGSLEASRGSAHLIENGRQLVGAIDVLGHPIDAASLARAEARAEAWSGGAFNGSAWSGAGWSGNSWSGSRWSGSSWSGNSWSSERWAGNSWSGNSWSGSDWASDRWR